MDNLQKATPELNDAERLLFFGDRSAQEREELAEMLTRADAGQRQKIYSVMRSWAQAMLVPQN